MLARRYQGASTIDPNADISVVSVSPEEASFGVAEFWQNDRLIATTATVGSRTVLRFEPTPDGSPIEIGGLALQKALAQAKKVLGEF